MSSFHFSKFRISLYFLSNQRTFGYVRVFGDLSRFNGFNFLKVYNIQPIHDVHEIYYHILQAMVDALSSERGPPVSGNFCFLSSIYFAHKFIATRYGHAEAQITDTGTNGPFDMYF